MTVSSDCADKTPLVTVTSSNEECETLIRTTSLPLPDTEAVEGDCRRKSTPVTSHMKLDFADRKYDRRMRIRPVDGVSGHVSQNVGNQSTCTFDNRVYSPGGSTSSRCSDDDEEDDDETVTSPYDQQSPVSPELTSEKYVYS